MQDLHRTDVKRAPSPRQKITLSANAPQERNERPDKETEKWLTRICKDLAFPTDQNSLAGFVADNRALVIKNFPEFRCYRDIVFYFKFFLNPDIRRFPAKSSYSQRDAELQFRWVNSSAFERARWSPPFSTRGKLYPACIRWFEALSRALAR